MNYFQKNYTTQLKKGFSLIEALALLFIFSLITITFYNVFFLGTRYIMDSKNRLGAIAVANEKMEIVRNLNYDAVGTKHLQANGTYAYGIPAGEILEDEDLDVNTKSFHVHTFVQYFDDAFDGKVSGTTPIDVIPNDYKRVKIEVSWGDAATSQTVELTSIFVPKGVEVSSGGGTLSINVIDNAGTGVSSATVHITNTSVSPHIDVTAETDSTGNLMLPGAPASSEGYSLAISKNAYYGVSTNAPYPTTSYKPVDVHASVVAAAFNQKALVMDKSSTIIVETKDMLGADLPSIGFHIIGGRKIGNTSDTPSTDVYSLDQSYTTDSSGEKSLGSQSSGSYTVTLNDEESYQLFLLDIASTAPDVFSASDGSARTANIKIIDKKKPSMLFLINESVSGVATPLENVSIQLKNTDLAYDVTLQTDSRGYAYFPHELPYLENAEYDYTISLPGYDDVTGTVTIDDALESRTIEMTQS